MRFVFFLILIVYGTVAGAQDTSSVLVHKDARVDILLQRQHAINSAYRRAAGRTMRGYRLLVLNTNSRDEAIAAKTKIYTYFPDLKSYLVYQSPFFKVKAGNFQTRDEAKKYQSLMGSIFPKGVFIISETIEVRAEKDDDE